MNKTRQNHIDVQTRQEADAWLEMSRSIARTVSSCMESRNLSRENVAERLGVSVQYVGRLLSGTSNLSLKSVARIETALDVHCFSMDSSIGK